MSSNANSLRIAPASSHATSVSNITTASSSSSTSAPSAPGVHDTLRSNLSLTSTTTSSSSSSSQPLQSTHPLESRLKNWQATQDRLKMNLLRRTHGMGEPIRRGMELKICKDGEWRPALLGGSASVSGDVLSGRDTEVTWEDVYRGGYADDVTSREGVDFHTEVEGRVRMSDW